MIDKLPREVWITTTKKQKKEVLEKLKALGGRLVIDTEDVSEKNSDEDISIVLVAELPNQTAENEIKMLHGVKCIYRNIQFI